jgi:hypothetical protein
MAGLGYKDFTVGQVLTSAEVDGYLMQQTIMKFADASARTTALTGVLAEGMFSYLADTNSTEYYDGSAWQSISNPGDITAIVTGTDSGLSGGATSGSVTLRLKLEFNAQTGTTYTLVAGDLNKLVTLSNASPITLTVPPSIFSAGDEIHIQAIGAGQVTLAQGAGVTITSTGATSSAPKLRIQESAATIICKSSNTFTVMGDIA